MVLQRVQGIPFTYYLEDSSDQILQPEAASNDQLSWFEDIMCIAEIAYNVCDIRKKITYFCSIGVWETVK